MISLPYMWGFQQTSLIQNPTGRGKATVGKRGLLLRGMVDIWNTEWQHLEARDE